MKLLVDIPDAMKKVIDEGKGEELGLPLWLAYSIYLGKPLDKVLDEIRAEIEKLPSELTYDGRRMIRRVRVYDIIDKHKEGEKNERRKL